MGEHQLKLTELFFKQERLTDREKALDCRSHPNVLFVS